MTFVKGQSGNPAGGRKLNLASLEARKHTEDAIKKLVEAMKADNLDTASRAANSLLDRAWGKPKESMDMELGGPNGEPITFTRISATNELIAAIVGRREDPPLPPSSEN